MAFIQKRCHQLDNSNSRAASVAVSSSLLQNLKQPKEIAQRPVGRLSTSNVANEHTTKRRKGHNTHDIPVANIRKDSVGIGP